MNRPALRGAEAERGSMPLVLLVCLVGMLLGALLVPMVINQDRTTRYATSRVHALDAAQAGIDVAVGRIRNATDGTTTSDGATPVGLSRYLPCGPLTGPVNSIGNGAYSVTISYYTADPVQHPGTKAMICVSGAGTYDTTSGASTPSYAKLESTGTDGPAVNGVTNGRTMVSYYVFRTSNTNIPGGVIRLYPVNGNAAKLCIDAGSTVPVAGTPLYLAACSGATPPAAQQVFTYRADLTLQLVSSATAVNPNGLCLDTIFPLVSGKPVTLQNCGALGSPLWHQQWSFNDNGHFEGSLSTSSSKPGTLAGICINAAMQITGQPITVATCAGSTNDPNQAWIPAPSVGSGAAGGYRLKTQFTNYQLVNFGEFGRCLDVTGQDPTSNHLIDYPCKQNPYPGAVTWNQIFSANPRPDGYDQLQTLDTADGRTYCLTSSGVDGGYATVKLCDSANKSQEFTLSATSFTITDLKGLCLGLTSPASGEQWSAIATGTCTGATTQKWDADPNISIPTFQNTYEHPPAPATPSSSGGS